MSLFLIVAIILWIIVLAGIFAYRIRPSYQSFGGFVAALASLLLFLMAINVIRF